MTVLLLSFFPYVWILLAISSLVLAILPIHTDPHILIIPLSTSSFGKIPFFFDSYHCHFHTLQNIFFFFPKTFFTKSKTRVSLSAFKSPFVRLFFLFLLPHQINAQLVLFYIKNSLVDTIQKEAKRIASKFNSVSSKCRREGENRYYWHITSEWVLTIEGEWVRIENGKYIIDMRCDTTLCFYLYQVKLVNCVRSNHAISQGTFPSNKISVLSWASFILA